MSTRSVIYFAAVLVAVLLVPASASADVASFSNPTPIVVPLSGPATPSASAVQVSGVRGPVTNVEVTLHGVSHTGPKDLDVLLVPPEGPATVLMSDTCAAPVGNYTWTFKSTGDPPLMPDASCPDFYYAPTNRDGFATDNWPDVAPSVTGNGRLTDYHGKPMNGEWTLYVVDDYAGFRAGKIARGWSLNLTTGPVDALIPGAGTFGLATPYPAIQAVDLDNQVVTDVNVWLQGIAHDRPDDLDLMLVGPHGEKAMLMSDACGTSELDTSIYIDDEAAAPLPDDSSPAACRYSVKPSDHEPGESLPAPAPEGPYGTSLSTFDFTHPDGEWRLYAADDTTGEAGYLTYFVLQFETRPAAEVEFADSAVQVGEGTARSVTIRRTAPGRLGTAAVSLISTPGSASAGADYTPILTVVRFAPDEREKTVRIDARADGKAEPAEKYSVSFGNTTGDATLGTRRQLEVTIPASKPDPQPGGGHGNPPPPAPRCDGKPATIVGTAGRDVLNGTGGRDVIVALAGNDSIRGVQGDDVVCAGRGNDTALGGRGRDRLFGGPGNDRLSGGPGRDTCAGGPGRNRLTCERKTTR